MGKAWVPKGRRRKGFPGGPVVKNPPSNAGDVGSIPGRGTKIPHAMGQLNLHATTKNPHSQNKIKRKKKEEPG